MKVEPARIQILQDLPAYANGLYVLYWMQQSQRAEGNPALDHAIELANRQTRGLLVAFAIDERYPEANERSFAFLLEGLSETAATLAKREIKLVLRRGPPEQVVGDLARDATCVVFDRGYLRPQRETRTNLAESLDRRVEQVEADVVVPIDAASNHAEYAARTIRPKIEALRGDYVKRMTRRTVRKSSLPLHVTGDLDPRNVDESLAKLSIDRSVERVAGFQGGLSPARRRLARFLRNDLPGYADRRNDPARPRSSRLSPHLHFGQISPVEIAHKVARARSGSKADRDAFLEELIVRRELSINFVTYTKDYDRFRCLPDWARTTLEAHANDERPRRYTAAELEAAKTHDAYWNAAMTEMNHTGFLDNHMRMYWGKKILEWSNTPAHAHRIALELNNRYLLDGRDASSYANVAWLFGLHDRAFAENPIYGKVRRMTSAGLERKFDMQGYVDRVEALAKEDPPHE